MKHVWGAFLCSVLGINRNIVVSWKIKKNCSKSEKINLKSYNKWKIKSKYVMLINGTVLN